MNVNQHVCIIRPRADLVSPAFLNLLLSSEIGQKQIWFFQQGGGREGLNFQALKNFTFPLPPKNEQERLLSSVSKFESKIRKNISSTRQSIEKLKEYKATLINSAVTGKIKVT